MQKRIIFKGLKVVYRCFNTTNLSTLPMARSYEAALKALNTLQSNASALQEICRSGQIRQSDRFEKAKYFASRAKVPVEELDKLSAIHISGTKGKGSVCAFCDNILREHGYKTGFFSSPHLVEVRERIRIDGKTISKEAFAKYFWECWDNLEQGPSDEKPPYFVFLTVMSFYIFMTEKIDVAIVEVGIGGAYDTTNIIRNPWVCGVTSLGYDHVAVLGGTTESIAWNKAGIFKPGVPAFTVPQDKISSRVLAQRAKELKATLKVAPDMFSYPGESVTTLGIEGKHQFQNASLAVQLCKTWLDHRKEAGNTDDSPAGQPASASEAVWSSALCNDKLIPFAETCSIDKKFKSGLQKTYWPGRSHCIQRNNYTLFLDGAHTPKSINACSSWFRQRADEEKQSLKPQSVARVLIFNCTGERDPRKLLVPLAECEFDYAVFCTNSVTEESSKRSSDLSDFTVSMDVKRKRCYENHEAWKGLLGITNTGGVLPLKSALHLNKTLKMRPNLMQTSCVLPSVTDAIHSVLADREPTIHARQHASLPCVVSRANHVQLIVTGSLHLVGAAMKVLGSDIIGEI